MSRLGLLFGADARNADRSASSNSGGGGGATLMSARSQDSSSSIKSFDAVAPNRLTSSNASPVSTLTGNNSDYLPLFIHSLSQTTFYYYFPPPSQVLCCYLSPGPWK